MMVLADVSVMTLAISTTATTTPARNICCLARGSKERKRQGDGQFAERASEKQKNNFFC